MPSFHTASQVTLEYYFIFYICTYSIITSYRMLTLHQLALLTIHILQYNYTSQIELQVISLQRYCLRVNNNTHENEDRTRESGGNRAYTRRSGSCNFSFLKNSLLQICHDGAVAKLEVQITGYASSQGRN